MSFFDKIKDVTNEIFVVSIVEIQGTI